MGGIDLAVRSGHWDQGQAASIMASNRKQSESRAAPHGRAPEWADGLKQLYDSVVEEDLPDSFRDLLDQLDAKGPPQGGAHGTPQ